jgi:NADH-quinone oxidoreductase subunit H
MLLPVGLANVFISGALVLWDPSLRALALVGLLQIGVLLALTLSRKESAEGAHGHGGGHGALGHGHGHDAHGLPGGAHGHAQAAHAGAHPGSTH